MRRLTRRLLTFVSIAGGGLLGAAPVAVAAPNDPSPAPPPVPVSAGDAVPSPVPAPDTVVRTGRSGDPGGGGDAPAVTVPGSLDAAITAVRTGRAADLAPTVSPTGLPGPVAPSRVPAAPVPVPSSPTPAGRPGATTARPATHPGAGPATGASASSPVAAAPPPPDPSGHVTVDGESLWSIAAAHLTPAPGQPGASIDAVTAYWQRLCDLNRPRLQSGDVNLIYPGEVIVLPPVAG